MNREIAVRIVRTGKTPCPWALVIGVSRLTYMISSGEGETDVAIHNLSDKEIQALGEAIPRALANQKKVHIIDGQINVPEHIDTK